MQLFWESVERLLFLVLPQNLSVDALYIFAALFFGIIIYLIGKFIN